MCVWLALPNVSKEEFLLNNFAKIMDDIPREIAYYWDRLCV